MLLAENRTGYANLMQLSTAAHAHDPTYPVVSANLLATHAEGLIALVGGLWSRLPALAQDAPRETEQLLKELRSRVGPDRLFIAISRDRPGEHVISDRELIGIARSLSVPILAVCDSHELRGTEPVFPGPTDARATESVCATW